MTESILKYNGIELRNVQTLSLVETPVYDDSGQQLLYNKISLRVLGYITKDNHSSIGLHPHMGESFYYGSTPQYGAGASQMFKALHDLLMAPRRRLIYSTAHTGYASQTFVLFDVLPPQNLSTKTIDDTADALTRDTSNGITGVPDYESIPVYQMSGMTDMAGGPMPKSANITGVANNQVWRVEFEVEFSIVPTCSQNPYPYSAAGTTRYGEDVGSGGQYLYQSGLMNRTNLFIGAQRKLGVLSHRWSCLDRYDEANYLVRTYTGAVTLANPHWNPHDYRQLTMPPLVPGMRRDAVEYKASEDGLKLHYTITDKEVTITPPAGCADVNISHTEASVQLGAIVNFNLRVNLRGEKTSSLYTMNRIAVAIVESRLNLTRADQPGESVATLVDQYEITSEQGSNQQFLLSCTVSGRRMRGNANLANPNGIPGQHFNVISNAVFARLGRGPTGSQLDSYNNMRALGNREIGNSGIFEQPSSDPSYVPTLSALHAAINTPCDPNFGFDTSIDTETEIDVRIDRQVNISETISAYNYDAIYGYYAPQILSEIYQNLPDSADLIRYTPDAYKNVYSHYDITSQYNTATSSISLPVAAAKTTQTNQGLSDTVFVDIGQKQRTRTIRITAERLNTLPVLPKVPDTFEEDTGIYLGQGQTMKIRHKKIDQKVIYQNPVPTADGELLLYTTQLEVQYAIDREPIYHRFGRPEYLRVTDDTARAFMKRLESTASPQNPDDIGVFSGSWNLWQ